MTNCQYVLLLHYVFVGDNGDRRVTRWQLSDNEGFLLDDKEPLLLNNPGLLLKFSREFEAKWHSICR